MVPKEWAIDMNIETYLIGDRQESFCDGCRAPLNIGDRCYVNQDTADIGCCPDCLEVAGR